MKEKEAAASQNSNINDSLPNLAASVLDTELNDILGSDPNRELNQEGSMASLGVQSQ